MRIFAGTLVGAGALAAVSLGLAGPAAAAGGADDVVNGLKDDGYSGHRRRRRTAHWCHCADWRCDLYKRDRIDEAARRYLAVLPGGLPVPAARHRSTRPIRP